MSDVDLMIAGAYDKLLTQIAPEDAAEMMIEAARDAEQTGFDIYKNPYTSGSMQSLMYINECQKHWIASVAKATETRKT